MPNPQVLLLDVMGTLVHDPFYVEVPRFFGMSLEALIEAKHPRSWLEFERSEIDEATLLRRFFRDGRAVDAEGLKAVMREAYRLLPGIEALLHELRARGVAMHAMSNYSCWYALIEQRVGLSRFLRWSFVSCDTGLRKPEPEAYRHVLAKLGVPAQACMLVDDRDDNCRAAQAEGMDAERFVDADALRRALVERGLL